MPWINDGNGERKYVLSIYAKEELPTWSEVYNDWYEKHDFFYDPMEESRYERDLYWKIPRSQYLQAVVCNQFNKMLFEDGMRQGLIDRLNTIEDLIVERITDVRFTLEHTDFDYLRRSENVTAEGFKEHDSKLFELLNVGKDVPPPIYTFPFPNGKNNFFITNNHPRTDVRSIPYSIMVMPMVKIDIPDIDEVKGAFFWLSADVRVFNQIGDKLQREIYYRSMAYMMAPFFEYFKNGVGWKDENGKLIASPKERMCEGVGSDPAL